jgi:HEPN domain-containing protein
MDDLINEWMRFSNMDFTAAKHMYDNMHPIPLEIVCYHCQQSAEKILKAFLIYSKIKPERTHDLEFLRSECEGVDDSFAGVADECDRLNRYSSQPRYPMEIEITNGDTLLALQDCKKSTILLKESLYKT